MKDEVNFAIKEAAEKAQVTEDDARAVLASCMRYLAARQMSNNALFSEIAICAETGDYNVGTDYGELRTTEERAIAEGGSGKSVGEVLDDRPKPGDGVEEKLESDDGSEQPGS